jgi:hypothetical protein
MTTLNYEGKIKPVFKCEEEFKPYFKESTCLLTISVGQEVHEGEKFLSTIDLVNGAFKHCTILVDDSLQRHTMQINQPASPDGLYNLSISEGDSWLERNKFIYSRLTIPHKIIRWDDWLFHPKYKQYHKQISQLLDTDSNYKNAFELTIREFLERYQNRTPLCQSEYTRAHQLCTEYLKEECTALCLWIKGGFNFEVYPGKRNYAMTATHEIFIKPQFPNLLNPVAIKFKNRRQLKPQIFAAPSSHP